MKKFILMLLLIMIVLIGGEKAYGLETFVVEKGDNFWKLSKKYDVNWFDLKKINADRLRFKGNPSLIYEGQKFLLPEVKGKEITPQVDSKKDSMKKTIFPQQKQSEQEAARETQVEKKSEKKAAGEVQIPKKTEQETPKVAISIPAASAKHFQKVAILQLETICTKIAEKVQGTLNNSMPKLILVVLHLIIFEPYIKKGLKYVFDCYRKKTKGVFVGYSRLNERFCLVSFDGSSVYYSENETEGLRDLASFVIKNCGYAEIRKISFAVPGYHREKFSPLDKNQRSQFENHALSAHLWQQNGTLAFE